MTPSSRTSKESAWFRQPIVWLMIVMTMAAVSGSINLLFVAIDSKDAMVTEDYYKHGKAINQVLQREQRAADLSLRFTAHFSDEQVTVEFISGNLTQLPAISLSMYHPTLEQRDLTLPLRQAGNARFVAQLPEPLNGRWDLRLEPINGDWRIQQPIALPRADKISLGQ